MDTAQYTTLQRQLRESVRTIERAFWRHDDALVLADLARVRQQLQAIAAALSSTSSPVPVESSEPDTEGRVLRRWAEQLLNELHGHCPPSTKKYYYIRNACLLLLGIGLLGGTICMGEWWRWRSADGLLVTYFSDRQLQQPAWRGVEMTLFRNFREWPPVWWTRADGFSSRWSGVLDVPQDAEYIFYAQTCDGLRFYLDGQCVLDNWRDQTWEESGRGVKWQLTKGPHLLVVEHYCRRTRDGALRIRWCGGGIPENTLLAAPYLRKRP